MAIKITALMIVINEADYVWWALKSIYEAVDKIVIVEGASRDNWGDLRHFTSKGLSTDNTQHEILRFIAEEDRNEKIIYLRVGFRETKNALRDLTLRLCPEDTDYCLVVDADHLYDVAQIEELRALCTRYPNIRVIYSEQLMFFQDLHHILVVDEQYNRPLGYHLAKFFFRFHPDLRYAAEASFHDHSLRPSGWLSSAPMVEVSELPESKGDVILYPPLFQFWHFGWVKRKKELERHLMRASWSHILEVKRRFEADPNQIKDADRRVWLPLIRKSEEEVLAYLRLYHKIWTGLFDPKVNERLIPYTGKYPLSSLIEKHPFWGKDRAWFGLEGF